MEQHTQIEHNIEIREDIATQIKHSSILSTLLDQIEPFDFRQHVPLEIEKGDLKKKHYVVIVIEQVLNIAKENKWGLCRCNDFIYVYNGAYWDLLDKEQLQAFLGYAAEKMGVNIYDAKHYTYRESLYNQFLAAAYLPNPEKAENEVCINLKNGTFVVTPERQGLRPHNSADFLTYQLPFNYDPTATAPTFNDFLNKVLPETDKQKLLAEYLGYIFIQTAYLKMEKALLLYGSGANGKSVFFEIVLALLGNQNVTNQSLQNLTAESPYYRALLSNKLLNYTSEISGKLNSAYFKQLVSGEPVDARLPYGQPFMLKNYAKLMFNCNELPKDVEHTNAYFRRFLIVPFDITIPENEQDKDLASKIISSELSGIFNWVLEGLQRLLQQKKFTPCEAADKALETYKHNSNSVKLFLQEKSYVRSHKAHMPLKELYLDYRIFCYAGGYAPINKSNFTSRLKADAILIESKNIGNVVYLEKALA